MAPQMKTERADPAEDRHHSAKQKPNRNRHVLGRFPVLGAVTKRHADACCAANRIDTNSKEAIVFM